jgi:exosortase
MTPAARSHITYAVLMTASVLVSSKMLAALVTYGWSHDSSSQILIIPAVSLFLAWLARRRIFAATRFSCVPGISVILGGGLLFLFGRWATLRLPGNEALSLSAVSIVIIWTGAFLLCYGPRALKAAAFPCLFLLLMVPIPDPALNWIIRLLQQGSTEIAYLIFRSLGIPVLREGFLLSVPGVTIEVAQECSSIRSSVALVITCLLAAHLYLRTWWKGLLLVLLSLPLSVIKNGIRVSTLTLLSLYVNPGFLHGRLHHEGGFVFFFLALLMLWPVFAALEKSDRTKFSPPALARTGSEAFDRG